MDTKKIIIAVASVVTALFLGLGIYWFGFRQTPTHLAVLGEGKVGQKMTTLMQNTWATAVDYGKNPNAYGLPIDPKTPVLMAVEIEKMKPIVAPLMETMIKWQALYTDKSNLPTEAEATELREYGKRLDAKTEILTALEKLEKSIKDAGIKKRVSEELLGEFMVLVDLFDGEKPPASLKSMLSAVKAASSELLVAYPKGLDGVEMISFVAACGLVSIPAVAPKAN